MASSFGNNIAFEFHGDYWHGNPTRFDPSNVFHGDKTFGDLYRDTISRDQKIREYGIELVVVCGWGMSKKIRRSFLTFSALLSFFRHPVPNPPSRFRTHRRVSRRGEVCCVNAPLVNIFLNTTMKEEMHLNAIRFIPPLVCHTLSCVVNQPLITRQLVMDDAGIAYAFDLTPTEGFYFAILAYACMGVASRIFVQTVRSSSLNQTRTEDR